MANWFKQHGVTDVVMESIEKYWIPVYNILEGEGIKADCCASEIR